MNAFCCLVQLLAFLSSHDLIGSCSCHSAELPSANPESLHNSTECSANGHPSPAAEPVGFANPDHLVQSSYTDHLPSGSAGSCKYFYWPTDAHMHNNLHFTVFIVCTKHSSCVLQVLLQPQFIKADSLLLTTLKPDVSMVTTVMSSCITSLATSTAPIQNTPLQVHKHSP